MRLSIVVPALDEAPRIVATLAALQPLRAAGHEVIVVDGGSGDATLALARPLADHAFVAPRGRARQMNAGAAIASGDVLLFLHADSLLTSASSESFLHEWPRRRRRWGRFDVTIAGNARLLGVVAAMMNARSRLTGIATGDQGLFVERTLFDAVGGYSDQPLMEDLALSVKLKRVAGRPLCLRQRIVTSGRLWERHGPWRTIVAMWRLRYAYWRGADPAQLAARYRTMLGRDVNPQPPTLQIFVKDPVPGTVKTRLGHAIGAERAAGVYARLAERTLEMAVAARAAGIVGRIELWCAPDAHRPVFAAWRDRYGIELASQSGDDLGARMHNALRSALARGASAILIGTDCPVLDAAVLARAATALTDHDAVLVPAEDGGYVLVGLTRPLDIFSGIAWSTADVMSATRSRLAAQRAGWHELSPLWDVDLPQDLARWEALDDAAPPRAAA